MLRAKRARKSSAATAFAFLLLLGGCGGRARTNKEESHAAASASPQASGANADAAATTDVSQLDAEIGRLEKLAEKNPGDDDARAALSKAYVSRGHAMRAAQRMRDALMDYQRALRVNPDNEDAQRAAAEISPFVEGEQTGENGEPAPLPITPNITDAEEKPAATQTPKKQ
jgi:cytochrome c-type biogenesis protein CcmH/NrfG